MARPTFWPEFELATAGRICRYSITDGQISFLASCTHDLAGKTVPLPIYPARNLT